jgi:hypothetical protein
VGHHRIILASHVKTEDGICFRMIALDNGAVTSVPCHFPVTPRIGDKVSYCGRLPGFTLDRTKHLIVGECQIW